MSELPSAREIAQHEGAHASAFICVGIMPSAAQTDWPTADTLGQVTAEWWEYVQNSDQPWRTLKAVLVAIVMPSLGVPGIDTWPIQPDSWGLGRRDAENIVSLAAAAKFDQVDWLGVLERAYRLHRDRRYRTLAVAITAHLERHEVATRAELIELTRQVDQQLNAAPEG